MSEIAQPALFDANELALERLLRRCHCKTPLHVIRVRFWGEIVSPSVPASPLRSINALWSCDPPTFERQPRRMCYFNPWLSCGSMWRAIEADRIAFGCRSSERLTPVMLYALRRA